MKFDELDKKLRVFETLNDRYVLPGIYIVARLDGRSFTRLTKDVHKFESPYDSRFRDFMVATVMHFMDCGCRVVFGYTQSDEISLLFHQEENGFGRTLRKHNSILAGEASAKFSLLLGSVGTFDCRISELPDSDLVLDYFQWRSEDASRNALNAHCYWVLRKGASAKESNDKLMRLSVSQKNELLFKVGGVNFNDHPLWHKRGVGVYREFYAKEAVNPKTGERVTATRKRLKVDLQLPVKDNYSAFVSRLMAEAG
ncbi:guanylyltransferase [Chromatiales bacterium (ex Bugula neritina AB1)]|nr:guanylyltransferase [Chromatiales bacterium (ex Bugula neritina AB1)]